MTVAPKEHIREQYLNGTKVALQDIVSGLRAWQAWVFLSWSQVRSSYRRTILGPWWISLQRAIFFAGISLLFGVLLAQDMKNFVPYVAVGFAVFQFLVTSINSATTVYTGRAGEILTSSLSLSSFSLRSVAANIIQLAHDAVVIAVVFVIFGVRITEYIFLLPIAIILLIFNAFAVSLWLGAVATRYRDVPPLVISMTSVLFFFTPIFWRIEDLSIEQRSAITAWNPLTYFVEITRNSLLGIPPNKIYWMVVFLITFANAICALIVFTKTRLQITYWVQT